VPGQPVPFRIAVATTVVYRIVKPPLAASTGVAMRDAREQLFAAAERDLGRLAANADVETLALTLIGTGHLLFAGREGAPPEAEEVRRVVTSVIAGAGGEARY
jgi:hypothetical protein